MGGEFSAWMDAKDSYTMTGVLTGTHTLAAGHRGCGVESMVIVNTGGMVEVGTLVLEALDEPLAHPLSD